MSQSSVGRHLLLFQLRTCKLYSKQMGKLTDTGYNELWLDVVSLTQRTCETGACSQSNEFRGSIWKKEHCERKQRETESFAGSCAKLIL